MFYFDSTQLQSVIKDKQNVRIMTFEKVAFQALKMFDWSPNEQLMIKNSWRLMDATVDATREYVNVITNHDVSIKLAGPYSGLICQSYAPQWCIHAGSWVGKYSSPLPVCFDWGLIRWLFSTDVATGFSSLFLCFYLRLHWTETMNLAVIKIDLFGMNE